ncbi:sulfotransferase domain-containing protein [Flavobacteriales bacterium]|nr:sulfotransferase domain-containing protein [Flavobacteriales bacterium]
MWEYLIREIVALIFWALRFFAPNNSLHLRLLGSILFGNVHGHKWLAKSWGEHLNGIENPDAFVLKYEDLKRAPIETCAKVMDYLELDADISQIKRSVDNQSFEKKKSGFLKNGETEKADFLSTGKIGGGDHKLKKIERWLIEKRFRTELSKFMYH